MRYGGARSGKLVVPYFGIRGGGGIDVCQFKNYKCDYSILVIMMRDQWAFLVEDDGRTGLNSEH